MITSEQEAGIRRLLEVEGWPVGTIARELRVHRSVVRHVLGTSGDRVSPVWPSRLDPCLPSVRAAFARWTGCPRVVLYDNLRSPVLERHADAPRLNPELVALATHYRFEPRPVAVARGNEKGRVERDRQGELPAFQQLLSVAPAGRTRGRQPAVGASAGGNGRVNRSAAHDRPRTRILTYPSRCEAGPQSRDPSGSRSNGVAAARRAGATSGGRAGSPSHARIAPAVSGGWIAAFAKRFGEDRAARTRSDFYKQRLRLLCEHFGKRSLARVLSLSFLHSA
jgi:hypothetical protein